MKKHDKLTIIIGILLFISLILLYSIYHSSIKLENIVYFMDDWEQRSECLSEHEAKKKYLKLMKSIDDNKLDIDNDPFSEKELKYLEQKNIFYSIGPDRVDQRLKTIYDPTNGVFSAGDIKVSMDLCE
jgi:hypothetical protein